jgi:cyclopropane fatty-acyl-phospholipid synthase-like methyltransferase
MLNLARSRCAKTKFILADMRTINLGEKFDCIIAWHSFFHLSPEDQRKMFKIFESHLKPNGILLFTTGPDAGEVWSNNGGESLYHASLSSVEYMQFLEKFGFEVLLHKIEDPQCKCATVWLTRLI